jgi:hypothetical protein
MCRAVGTFKRVLSSWQKSQFKLVKIHAMLYYNLSIHRSSVPHEYSSNMYEQLHIALMKIAYRRSNKKGWQSYIVKHYRRLQALRKRTIGREGFELPEHRDMPLTMVCTNLTFNSFKNNMVAYCLREGFEIKLIEIYSCV